MLPPIEKEKYYFLLKNSRGSEFLLEYPETFDVSFGRGHEEYVLNGCSSDIFLKLFEPNPLWGNRQQSFSLSQDILEAYLNNQAEKYDDIKFSNNLETND